MKQPLQKDRTVRDLTTGNPYSLIVSFALPIFFSQLFQQLYNTADSLIVGHFLGTEALAAVSSSGMLIFLMTSFFEGTAMGAGVVISRYFGARNDGKVSRSIHTSLAFGLLAGVILTVAGILFTPTLLVWMKTDPQVLPGAIEYFRYYFAGSMAVVLYNASRSIMTALGDSRRPLYYLVFSSVLNIVLDILFVGVFRWDVWSAALATVISQAASAVLCLMRLAGRRFAYPVKLRQIRLHGDILREILRYGLPSGVQNSVIALANVIVQTQVNSFGMLATAAFGSHCKIEGFAFLPITSFCMAISTFTSQNLGAREYDRAKIGARFGILGGIVMAELVGVLVYTFSPQLIGLFDSNPGVIEYGVTQERTVTLFYCLLAFSHCTAAVLRGAGKAFVPMVIMLGVWCVIRIAYILLVMHFIGEIRFVYWAYPITWSISSVLYFVYMWRSDWVHGFEEKTAVS